MVPTAHRLQDHLLVNTESLYPVNMEVRRLLGLHLDSMVVMGRDTIQTSSKGTDRDIRKDITRVAGTRLVTLDGFIIETSAEDGNY